MAEKNPARHAAQRIIAGYHRTQELMPAAGGVPRPIEESTDHAVVLARTYLEEHPEPNPAYEELAAKFRVELRKTPDGAPDGTRTALEGCAGMLDAYGPDLFPANEKGQVPFARAMMESVADEIRTFLTKEKT